MKKIVAILLSSLMSLLSIQAQNFINIHYNNGQDSESYYIMDIDSIVCSKIDIDNKKRNNWEVQEIWMGDSVRRIPLAIIDNVSRTYVDIDSLAGVYINVIDAACQYYMKSKNTQEMSLYIDDIKKVSGVADVRADNNTLFIDIINAGTIFYTFPSYKADEEKTRIRNEIAKISETYSHEIKPANRSSSKKNNLTACIVKQWWRDDGFKKETIDTELRKAFEDMEITVDNTVISPSPEFLRDDLFHYDLILLLTHGFYDDKNNLHGLYSGEELLRYKIFDDKLFKTTQNGRNILAKQFLKQKRENVSFKELSIGFLIEEWGEDTYQVAYTVLSDDYIRKGTLKNKQPIIFSAACKTMQGNSNMAKAYCDRGAKAYIGFDETSKYRQSGLAFYTNLLSAKSLSSACLAIPLKWRVENTEEKARLLLYADEKNKQEFLFSPETKDVAEPFDKILHGEMKVYDASSFKTSNCGFLLSENKEMTNASKIHPTYVDYNSSNHLASFKCNLSEISLKSNTKYYYRAFVYDDAYYCYGEVKNFVMDGTNLCPDDNHPHIIDLGLPSGTKWVCRNIGAQKPEEYGGYYAWGEIKEKDDYSQWEYKWGSLSNLKKYCTMSNHGTVDNLTTLEYSDDIAYLTSDGLWVMPTYDQLCELVNNCTSRLMKFNGVWGRTFTGPNGNTIFLPMAGYRNYTYEPEYDWADYWSSTLCKQFPANAYSLSFNNNMVGIACVLGVDYNFRDLGFSIRPVARQK